MFGLSILDFVLIFSSFGIAVLIFYFAPPKKGNSVVYNELSDSGNHIEAGIKFLNILNKSKCYFFCSDKNISIIPKDQMSYSETIKLSEVESDAIKYLESKGYLDFFVFENGTNLLELTPKGRILSILKKSKSGFFSSLEKDSCDSEIENSPKNRMELYRVIRSTVKTLGNEF